MPTYLHPARDAIVFARVPAGAARIAADELRSAERDALDAGEPGTAQRLRAASDALHAAGWNSASATVERAAEYSRDHEDAEAVAIDLPTELALALLRARGWTIEPVPGGNAYVKPGCKRRADGGAFGADYLWDRGEALRLAVLADALLALAAEGVAA